MPPDNERGWIRYAASTLLNHIKVCTRQSSDNRAHARHERESPRKHAASSSIQPNVPLPLLSPYPTFFQHPQMLPPSIPSTRLCSPATSTVSTLPSPLPLPYLGLMLPGPMDQTFPRSPLEPSPGQSFSHLTPGSQSQSSLIDDRNLWPSMSQKRFEEKIARLTAAAGLPLSWVDNPEWIDFVNDFLPYARSPSRKVLTNRLIPAAVKKRQDETKVMTRDQNATLQADGWTGANFHHLLAFLITVNKQVRLFSLPPRIYPNVF